MLRDCVKPWPGMKCPGQERGRCGETIDSCLGVVSWEFKWNCCEEICLCPCRARDTCSAQSSCGSCWYWWLKSSSELSVLYAFFFSFLLWIEISPWQMILCPNCPKVTPSCEISRAVSVGAEPRVEACILISYGLTSLMKGMVVVSHLTLVYFAVFVSEKRQKAQLQQRSWKLQVWAWLENAKLPSVVRLCGVFFCRPFA